MGKDKSIQNAKTADGKVKVILFLSDEQVENLKERLDIKELDIEQLTKYLQDVLNNSLEVYKVYR